MKHFFSAHVADPGPNLGFHDQNVMLDSNLKWVWLGRVGLESNEPRTNISNMAHLLGIAGSPDKSDAKFGFYAKFWTI